VWADVAAAEPLARHLRALLDLVEAHALPADSVTVWPTMSGHGSISVRLDQLTHLDRWCSAIDGPGVHVLPDCLSRDRQRVLVSRATTLPGGAYLSIDACRPATDADRERLGGAA
jgi:hypothetical protein